MTCYLHPDAPATAFCRSCGRPLCALCQRTAEGTVFCQEHAPNASFGFSAPQEPVGASGPDPYNAAPPPYTPPPYTSPPYTSSAPFPPSPSAPVGRTSPVAAFWLGLIPGVGAIYNGQYMKGLVHAIILGVLLSLTDSAENTAGQPLLGMVLTAFWFYMAFEAYHTAKKRQLGAPVEEWSSLLGAAPRTGRVPLGPIILIGIGVIFLLDTMHLLDFREFGRFWPVILILVGAHLLYSRLTTPARVPPVRSASVPPSNPVGPNPVAEDRP
ncbi:MAG: B-box zinc finger protein [Acidobacteriaceae bacterium]|nr:B-box zinc finger protein [Acidobacteriaceae bacterium]